MYGKIQDEEFYSRKSDEPSCSELHGTGVNCTDLQGPLWFGLTCKHVAKPKPWLFLMEKCDCKERSAHNYVAGHSIPDATVFLRMLKTPVGYQALEFNFQYDRPDWWAEIDFALRLKRAIEGVRNERSSNPIR